MNVSTVMKYTASIAALLPYKGEEGIAAMSLSAPTVAITKVVQRLKRSIDL